MSETLKTLVQHQFGASVDDYALSHVHAKGESLLWLLTLIQPELSWQMLDVATGAGHTALTFAPHVGGVIATDLTEGMVNKAAQLARERGLSNFNSRIADAEDLPFADSAFDLVTCRIALHHFPNPRQAIGEFARVLKPGGILGFTDNVTVPNKQAAGYHNAFEKLRDPSHNWVYPELRLRAAFEQAGLTIEATRQFSKEMEFHDWAGRQNVSPENKAKLLTMMRNAPEPLLPLFEPRWADDTLYFSLWEWVCVGRKHQG